MGEPLPGVWGNRKINTAAWTSKNFTSASRESMKVKHRHDNMDFQKWNLQLILSTDWTDWLMLDARSAGLSLRHVTSICLECFCHVKATYAFLYLECRGLQEPVSKVQQWETVRDSLYVHISPAPRVDGPLVHHWSMRIYQQKLPGGSVLHGIKLTEKNKKQVPWIKFHQIQQRSSLAFPKGRRNDRPSRRVPVPSSAMAIISCQNTKVLCYGNVKRASSLMMLILKKCAVQ